MQATITYLLTEQAQRTQMAATGQPVARKQVKTVEVPTEDIDIYTVSADGSLTLDLTGGWGGKYYEERVAAGISPSGSANSSSACGGISDDTDIVGAINRQRAIAAASTAQKKAEAQSARDNAVQSYLAGAELDAYEQIREAIAFRCCDYYVERDHPLYGQVRAEYLRRKQVAADAARETMLADGEDLYQRLLATPQAYAYRNPVETYEAGAVFPRMSSGKVCFCLAKQHPRMGEWIAELQRRKDAADAAVAAREQAKADYITAWITEHADPETQSQFADGLLCRKAAVTLIADAAFAASGVPERAKWNDTFCDASSCPCGEKSLDCLPRSVYPAWKALKASLPKGYAVEFLRVRECLKSDDDYGQDGSETAGPPIYLAKITMPHGPFSFERTVELK